MADVLHIEGTALLVFSFIGGGIAGEAQITMGVQTDNNDVQQVADKANRACKASITNMQSQAVFLSKVKASLVTSAGIEIAESFAGLPFQAAGSLDCLPMNVAILIQKRTAFAGRKNRGRFYVPAVPNTSVNGAADPNGLTASALSGAQTMADTFFAQLTDSDDGDPLHPVILHPTPSTTVTQVTSFSVQGRLATQRGRLRD